MWVDYVGDQRINPYFIHRRTRTTTIPAQVNFAFGGSSSGLDNTFISGIPGVLAQVGLFTQGLQANQQKADPNALYAVWGGGNDYLFGSVPDPNQTVKNLSDSVALLAQAGAKNILVFNLPDLGKLPYAAANGISSELTTLSTSHNATLAASLNNLSSIPDVNIIPIDIYSLSNQVLANPGEFGFQNVTTSCVIGNFQTITSVCNNPNDFYFFDAYILRQVLRES